MNPDSVTQPYQIKISGNFDIQFNIFCNLFDPSQPAICEWLIFVGDSDIRGRLAVGNVFGVAVQGFSMSTAVVSTDSPRVCALSHGSATNVRTSPRARWPLRIPTIL